MNGTTRTLPIFAVAVLATGQLHADTGIRYSIASITTTDLGTLGGAQSMAYDINSSGHVVGWAETATGIRHAFIHRGLGMGDIGFALGATPSEARGINSVSAVVGFSGEFSGSYPDFIDDRQAFVSFLGVLTPLNDTVWGSDYNPPSVAYAIADDGNIAGARIVDYVEATVWIDEHTFYSINGDTFPWNSLLYDINSDGYVVGHEKDRETTRRWRFDPAGTSSIRIPGPAGYGVDGYWDTEAFGINRIGGIVGTVYCCSIDHRFMKHATYWNGVAEFSSDLGVLPDGRNSVADDINNTGFIVGYADSVVRLGSYIEVLVDSAFLYHRHFGMRALPKPASTAFLGDCHATALNDVTSNNRVQVVGYCETANGLRAIRWDVALRKGPPPGTTP